MRAVYTLVCLAVCVTSFAAEVPLACKTAPVPLKSQIPVEDLATGTLPIPDYQDTVIACRYAGPFGVGQPPGPAPTSAWLDSQRARYAAVLAKQPADILVVPFGIQGYGLDRIERAVMASDLAYAIGDASALRVADPFLTALALGEGNRRFDPGEVQRLAQTIGARWILFGYVGHDLKHTFTVTLQLKEAASRSPSKSWQRDWRSVPFKNDRTPAYVWHEMLPAILKELPVTRSQSTVAASPSLGAGPSRINTSPVALATDSSQSTSRGAILSLIATLVPRAADLERERLFERVLLTALRSSSSNASQRFLESYALFNLHRRPTALARIAGQEGPSFQALRSLLDGDLPAAQSASQKVKSPFEQFLLQVLVRDLEYHYGSEKPAVPTAVQTLFATQVLPAWTPLIAARLEDGNRWFTPEASSLKMALDDAFPSKGLELEALMRGTGVTRGKEPDDADIDFANTRHIQKITAALDAAPCCRTRDLRPGQWDLLWLLQAAAEARIERRLWAMIELQDLPERALTDIARYEPLFKGHPALTALSASAAVSVSMRSPDDTRANWIRRAQQDGVAAIRWSPGQNRLAYVAAAALGVPSPESEIWVDVYGYDFPRSPAWFYVFLGFEDTLTEPQRLAFASEAYDFSTAEIDPLSQLSGPTRDAALASLGTRFTGHPARPRPPPSAAQTQTPEGRIAAALAAAKNDPNQYFSVGYEMLLSERPLKHAFDAFLTYPPFQKRTSRDAVGLSNEAYGVGSRFFWMGRGDLAKPFFQIAADLNTGSDASMSSLQRLHMLAGDYREAAEIAQQRVRRYASPFAERDYLSLLHALGEHDAAWAAFSQLKATQSDPAVWSSTLVGHRMQQLDESAFRAWLQNPEIRDATFRAQRFASYYALLWSSTDRVPAADFGAFVEQLEGKPVARKDVEGLLRPHPVDPTASEWVRPTFKPEGVTSAPIAEGTPLKSERAYLADAYSAVAREDYKTAVDRFAAMATLYPIEGVAMSYLAYAASRTGDTLNFEKYVMRPTPGDYDNFDIMLARTFFAAGHKQVDQAYRLLGLAFRAKPVGDERPTNAEYQFAQACEWLYRDTHDARFAATLLEWAKSYQTVQPTAAWAYAVQYQYDKDSQARIRALAMTLYLDPLSDRIRSASKSDSQRAQAWLATNNPFQRARELRLPPPVANLIPRATARRATAGLRSSSR